MCKTSCKLCDRLVISQTVTFDGTNLIINLPAGSYQDGERYCIVGAQAIPATATINAPVFVTIGTGTATYPLDQCNCTQATASGIRTRTRYAVRVSTDATSGTFRLLGRICCVPGNKLTALGGETA